MNIPFELYHGSSHHIKTLEPRPTRVLEGESAVFATDSKALSTIFIPKWTDCDFQLGYHNGRLYAMELYPDRFDLLKVKNEAGFAGYIYTVSSEGFGSDDRLGMKLHEFVNPNKVDIIRTEIVEDVYEFLMNSPDISMITFDQMMESVEKAGLLNTISD